jgi:hypothetical protein
VDWHLWFVQLSGWPVFWVVVAISMAGALLLSVLMPRLANRSIIQNALLAVAAVAVIGFGLLALVGWLTRR